MNKNLYKVPLKLTGDRVLFIVIAWIFSITLTIALDFILSIWGNPNHIGIVYSILTALPYLSLIYYEAFDVGLRERNKETASMKNAFLYCLFFQVPSIILFIFYLLSLVTPISTDITKLLLESIWLAPFIGPRGTYGEASALIQYIVFMGLEWGFFLFSYYLGMNDILLIKRNKKKSSGFMKK